MAKTALLIEMINLLRGRPGISVPELAASLGRSERTIYRWLSELSAEIGAPVYFRDGGYYLAQSERASSMRFTAEELLALRSALRSPVFGDGSPLRGQAQSAWTKVRDASSSDDLLAANGLAESYSVHVTAPKGYSSTEIPRVIENAISERRRLKIVYRSQKSNCVKDYTIDPYALVFRRHSWYLLAHSAEHGKIAQFKLVRLREARETETTFEMPADFSVDDYFRLSWEAWAGGEPVDVRVRFGPEVASMVAEAKRHPTQRVCPQMDGGIIFEATVAGIEEIAIWVMGFGKDAEALEPPELRAHIRDHALAMATMYAMESEEENQSVRLCDCDSVLVSDRALIGCDEKTLGKGL